LKLQVSSYNNGGSAWNAEAEETAFRSYKINHEFNKPAEAEIVLADPTGTIAQKYNVDANDVYIGVGKVTIEDPDATDIFYGRIIRAEASFQEKRVVLYCRDWLDQLDEEQIIYDMREDLDTNGVRQSEATSDVDGTCKPVSMDFVFAGADDGGVVTDETTEANEDTADDMTLLPAAPAENDAYLFGLATDQTQITIDISTAGVGTWTITWEWNEVGAEPDWVALEDVVDGTNGFTTAGECVVSWTHPGVNWVTGDPEGLGTAYYIRARVSAYTSITTQPLGRQVWQPQILYDDSLTLVADSHNGKYLIFTNDIAGTKTITVGPYADTVSANVDTENGSYANVWLDDANYHEMIEIDSTFTVDYDFHINAELGSIYSSGPSSGNIYLTYMVKTVEPDAIGHMLVKVKSAAEAYTTVADILFDDSTTGKRTATIKIPEPNLSGFVDTAGEVTIQLVCDVYNGSNTTLQVYQCLVDLTYSLTGTSDKYLILDTTTNAIITAGNLTYNGLGIYESSPYSVVQPIYKHIDSAETPGALITDGDVIVTLTCAATIEHTSGFSARQFMNRTRLEILQDLAIQDAALFYIALGGTTVTWKSTFNSGAPTAIGDATVNDWLMRFDYGAMVNNARVYGMRDGDNELFVEVDNATSQSKYIATRSQTIHNTGLVSEYDATAAGTAITNRDNEVVQLLNATITGLDSTYRLATEVSVTSTWLNLSAVAYVVNRWAYDSEAHETYITLYPRSLLSTNGAQPVDSPRTEQQGIKQTLSKGRRDTYVPPPVTNTVT